MRDSSDGAGCAIFYTSQVHPEKIPETDGGVSEQ